MWRKLIAMGELDREALRVRCLRVQKRVERIAGSVNRRRDERRTLSQQPKSREPGFAGWVAQFKDEITSPPDRGSLAPIVIQEELAYHAVAGDVPVEVAAEIQAHPELYPGLRIRETTTRTYPTGSIAAHLVGARTRVADSDDPHRVGRSGVERSFDGRLRGIDGERTVKYNRRGEVISSRVNREPVSGRDVVLTVDLRLQKSAESLLDQALEGSAEPSTVTESSLPAGGCAVVIDVHSGEVLTMANAPRYDLNLLTQANSAEWKATVKDPRHPLFPRATQMTAPPGSVYKVLTAVAMLEGGGLDGDEHRLCRGYLDRPDRHRCYIYRHHGVGHGEVNLRSALAQSCNVYFFEAARAMGPAPMVQWSQRFGFGQRTGIDLPFERGGNLPAPPDKNAPGQNSKRWYPGDTLGLAIGQSRLTVTPLQVARMMAAIANGGYLVTPRAVDQDGADSNALGSSFAASQRRRIRGLSSGTVEQIRRGLFSAVQDPGGTGFKTVRLDSVSIAGKTGTAEVGKTRRDHAWFAGYVPANRPQYAFVVMLEHGGSGGESAGPVAKKLVQAMINHDLLETDTIAQSN